MALALLLHPTGGWSRCLACGKPTYLVQARMSSHDSEAEDTAV